MSAVQQNLFGPPAVGQAERARQELSTLSAQSSRQRLGECGIAVGGEVDRDTPTGEAL